MAPRPLARGCRLSPGQRSSTHDGIWISDNLLAHAFERYCLVSRASSDATSRRHVSFSHGPLEVRRRLGRRRMTALNPSHSHGAPPPWALEYSPDLQNWNWLPPQNSTYRSPDAPHRSSSLLNLLGGWLQGPNVSSIESTAPSTPPLDANVSIQDRLGILIDGLRTRDSPPLDEIRQFSHALEDHILYDDVSSSKIVHTIKQFSETLWDTFGGTHKMQISQELLDLYGRVCYIASNTPSRVHDNALWEVLISEMAKLDFPLETTVILADLLEVIPAVGEKVGRNAAFLAQTALDSLARSTSTIHDDVLFSVEIPGGPGENEGADYQRVAKNIARALSKLSDENGVSTVYSAIHNSLRNFSIEESRTLRLLWLSVLAHMPNIRQPQLLEAMSELISDNCDLPPLTDLELCQLQLYHWTSRGYLGNESVLQEEFDRYVKTAPKDLVLANFARAIVRKVPAKVQVKNLANLCKTLQHQGRLAAFGDSFRSLCQESEAIGARSLAHVAVACNDHLLALELYDLTIIYEDKFYGGPVGITKVWNWRQWRKYIDAMVDDTSLPAERFWAVMARVNLERELPGASLSAVLKTVRFVDQLLACLGRAPLATLAGEEGFRHVTNCVRFLTSRGVALTPSAMVALTRLVRHDLETGTTRNRESVELLLGLISKHVSFEDADSTHRLISRWREENRHASRVMEVAAEQTA